MARKKPDFSSFLILQGRLDLVKDTPFGKHPLNSRIEFLRRAGGTDDQVRDLLDLWYKWRGDKSSFGCLTCYPRLCSCLPSSTEAC